MSKAKKSSLFLKKLLFFIFLQSFQFKFKIYALLLLSFRLLCKENAFSDHAEAEATRTEPIFVAPAQRFTSFLSSIWAILQATKWHKINTLESVHFYFLYPSSPHLPDTVRSCLIVLDLEYFVASRQWPFFSQHSPEECT